MKKNNITRQILFVLSVGFILIFPLKAIAQEGFTVVLDAGHGGKDPGKHAGKYNEKEIALSVVLLTGELLKKDKDVKVIYTREKDVFIELKQRGKIANDADADLFVSVHCNAHDTQAYGAETYVLGLHANKRNFEVAKQENSVIFMEDDYEANYKGFDPNSPESVIGLTLMQEEFLDNSLLFASSIQTKFTKELKRKDRGVKQAGFVVLHQTYMPSVLIEIGFITNKNEGVFLASKAGQNKVANAIYDAIMEYKEHLDKNSVVDDGLIPNSNSDAFYEGVDFKVQIASSSKKLALKPYNFMGLKDVERLKIGKQFKYYYGKTSNYDEAVELKKHVRSVGHKSAFIVAFKDGEKVSVSKILKNK